MSHTISAVNEGMRAPPPDHVPTYSYVDNLAFAAPSIRGRRVALRAAIVVVVMFVCAVPFAAIQLPEAPAFLTALSAVAMFGTALTALILGSQYKATHYPPLALLTLAYAVQSILVFTYLLTFPHLFATTNLFGSGPQTAAWLYPAWHYGFFVCLGAYAVSSARMHYDDASHIRNRRYVTRFFASSAFAVGMILFITVLRSDSLPPIVLANGHFSFVATHVVEPALLVANAVLLFIFIRGTRLQKVVDIWIAVTLVAFFCDTMLACVLGGGRFTVGWYIARMDWCVASVAFPIALVTQMSAIIAGLSTANRSLEVASDTDALTGLNNRRGFDVRFENGVTIAKHEGSPLSLLIIDVDEFKLFNDTFGHPAGDVALRAVAVVLQGAISLPLDFAGRIGGEEFAIVLPNTKSDGAFTFAEHIRESVAALAIKQYPGCLAGHLTVSIGVASSQATAGGKPGDLMARADHALYAAKRSGRNRTHIAGLDRPRSLEGSAS